MNILIICSKNFYGMIPSIKEKLEKNNHVVYLPNCYDKPDTEDKMRLLGEKEHREFKAKMFSKSEETIKNMDAVLVLNFDKEKDGIILKNYVGGATFLEMYDAFRFNKKIYLFNDIPEGILNDEIKGFDPIVIDGNIDIIKN